MALVLIRGQIRQRDFFVKPAIVLAKKSSLVAAVVRAEMRRRQARDGL
jgi:hypothetical protein